MLKGEVRALKDNVSTVNSAVEALNQKSAELVASNIKLGEDNIKLEKADTEQNGRIKVLEAEIIEMKRFGVLLSFLL